VINAFRAIEEKDKKALEKILNGEKQKELTNLVNDWENMNSIDENQRGGKSIETSQRHKTYDTFEELFEEGYSGASNHLAEVFTQMKQDVF
jgi:hypothetical protein